MIVLQVISFILLLFLIGLVYLSCVKMTKEINNLIDENNSDNNQDNLDLTNKQ